MFAILSLLSSFYDQMEVIVATTEVFCVFIFTTNEYLHQIKKCLHMPNSAVKAFA